MSVITGAGRGAGLGIAGALADEGGTVVVCDIDAEASHRAAAAAAARSATSLSIPCDVSDEKQVEDMMAEVVDRYGTVDVLINTVAWIDPPGPIVDLPTDRWHKAIRTNLDSVMYTTRAALRTMIPNRSGVIVNVSSLNGTRGFPDRASYGATKAAVINFTQTTAMENRQHGIRANCLVPGAIDGQRLRTLQGGMAAQPEQVGGARLSSSPNTSVQVLNPEWIGRYVCFLVSPEGVYLNGQALVIGEAPRSRVQSLFADL